MRLTQWLFAALLALVAPGALAALPPGISGAWYNPAQSGHGLTVELLDGDRALVFWHVFDPQGQPIHLYIEGQVAGTRIDGQAYLGRGMRFGSFDPDEHLLDHWGSVSLAFANCNAATLDWQPDGPAGAGYPAGTMPLQRLTALEGLDCDLNEPLLLPGGHYAGNLLWLPDRNFGFDAAVDSAGRLWGTVGVIPTNGYVGALPHYVFAGTPAGSPLALDLAVLPNLFLEGPPTSWTTTETVPLELDTQADGSLRGTAFLGNGFYSVSFLRQAGVADPLQRDFDPATLEGLSFAFTARAQFFTHAHLVRFLAGGQFCIDSDREACVVSGSIRAEDPGLAMFSITAMRGAARYAGKGWVEYRDGEPWKLVMVAVGSGGSHDGSGLGVVAERAP